MFGTIFNLFFTAALHRILSGQMKTFALVSVWECVAGLFTKPKQGMLFLSFEKDSHIGAFAVIMLTLYGLIFLGGFSEITECRTLVVAGAGSFLSRVLSGVAVVSFPSAKQEGTLYLFADKAHKRVVKTALYAQGILCIGFMMWTSFVTGGIAVAAALLTFAYYYYRSKKEFGGITGDTAGYFVTFCEGCVVVAAAIAEHMMLTV